MSPIRPLHDAIALLAFKAEANLSALSQESHRDVERQSQQTPRYTYTNEIQRFQIWASEHGVLHGRLDHKLGEASRLRNRILTLLTELCGETNVIHYLRRAGKTDQMTRPK